MMPTGRVAPARDFDELPSREGHVIIAGFGRFGQIVARVLRAKRMPLTALDISPDQIDVVQRFGSKVYYGDASRPDILAAAQADKARAFVLAIDDVAASLRTAEIVRAMYPELPIYARARNRTHAHRLMDLGVGVIRRETFLSALDLTRELLRGLGLPEREVRFAVDAFRAQDERRLLEDYKHYTDEQKLQERARTDAEELKLLFEQDAREQGRRAKEKTDKRA
jgi:glutathione-regulated potassium-efflux system protein KefB